MSQAQARRHTIGAYTGVQAQPQSVAANPTATSASSSRTWTTDELLADLDTDQEHPPPLVARKKSRISEPETLRDSFSSTSRETGRESATEEGNWKKKVRGMLWNSGLRVQSFEARALCLSLSNVKSAEEGVNETHDTIHRQHRTLTPPQHSQNDEGNIQLRKAPQQVARFVQTLWPPLYARPEAHLRQLRVPERRHQKVYVCSHRPCRFDNETIARRGHGQYRQRHLILIHTTDNWGEKAKRRKTTGSGRMRSLKLIPRKFKNGFQLGTPKGARGPANQ
ncbi:hypothetical protein AC579_5192 [Pseudocercospora musae]|uniref:Uncharacterized protein n=1 Tax=Pseudocercospora musae TaxID=113226 RepID=A0A139IB57_9PEZI|nr:hypothetical protein AC579_5192 [Pseudocercospora musae]